jgi:hypothetical protein
MKAGKKGRQAIFHNSGCLTFALLQRLVLWEQRYPHTAFFQELYGLTKRDNIKEDVK